MIVLIASGGHTQIVLVEKWGSYKILGRTRDDAAGEAFDKVSRLLNLGYPGGPFIEKHALTGDPDYVRFPRAFLEKNSYDFSFSGLKTAVMYHMQRIPGEAAGSLIDDVCRCFQDAVVDVLVSKTVHAAKNLGVPVISIAGGVAVNKTLQQQMTKSGRASGIDVYWPSLPYCTDNGGMIARAGYYYLSRNITSALYLVPVPSLNFL